MGRCVGCARECDVEAEQNPVQLSQACYEVQNSIGGGWLARTQRANGLREDHNCIASALSADAFDSLVTSGFRFRRINL